MANCGATANAVVSNHWLDERLWDGSVGLPTRFGRWTPKPANALKFVVCVTAMGTPDCSVTSPVTVQSLAMAPSHPSSWWARPAPYGMSQTTDDSNTCGMSPVE